MSIKNPFIIEGSIIFFALVLLGAGCSNSNTGLDGQNEPLGGAMNEKDSRVFCIKTALLFSLENRVLNYTACMVDHGHTPSADDVHTLEKT
jgi:hypothetical protein